MISVLTINAALQDVRLFSHSFYKPLDHTDHRLPELANQIRKNDPDIVCIQELFHIDLQRKFYSMLESTYPYVKGFAPAGPKLRLGNELLILSRFPVYGDRLHRFTHAPLEERLFTSKGIFISCIELPAIGKVQLVNFHMTAGGINQHPEHPAMENMRAKQIQQLLSILQTEMPVILAGDLNAGPDVSIQNYQQLLNAGFIDAFASSGGSGITWDPQNPLVANYSEKHLPPQRIDHIFLNNAANKILHPDNGSVVLNTPCVYIQENVIPVSDHYGLRVDFRLNSG